MDQHSKATFTMEDSIDLTLQSVHGIVWNPLIKDSTGDRISMKACVSFSGSAPNMKVSSCNMCPRTGNLVIESNDLGFPEDEEVCSRLLATFEDPLEGQRSRRRLGSHHSASVSSSSSHSSYRPHLQFQLEDLAQPKEVTPDHGKQSERIIELHVTIRSGDGAGEIYHEGVAHLIVGEKVDLLPLTMNLPISARSHPYPAPPADATERVAFDDSAFVSVLLSTARDKYKSGSMDAASCPQPELVLSENIDEKELGGLMKMMHEREEMDEARFRAVRLNFRGLDKSDERNRKTRQWMLLCNGASDFKQSFQVFLDVIRGCDGKRMWKKTKCLDPEHEIFLNTTMASTIDTRDSLEI
jgi:hypothetical protein